MKATTKSYEDDRVIYLLPSLGSDHRLFQNFEIEGYETHIIEYPTVSINEPIEEYCKKLVKQIKHENPILLGVSFGGLLSIELAKIISSPKVFLISTIKNKTERPYFLTFCRSVFAYRWISIPYFKKYIRNRMANDGLLERSESSRLYIEMLEDADEDFLLWGFKQVCIWKGSECPSEVVHFHGTADEVFPFSRVNQDEEIKDGDHMMIFNSPEKILPIIEKYISGSAKSKVSSKIA